jgi:hypothetical protein
MTWNRWFSFSIFEPVSSRLACSLYDAMAGSLPVASTAGSSTNVAVMDSGEFGRSAVYSRYNNDPRTLPLSSAALTEDSFVYSFSTLRGNVYYANRNLGRGNN